MAIFDNGRIAMTAQLKDVVSGIADQRLVRSGYGENIGLR